MTTFILSRQTLQLRPILLRSIHILIPTPCLKKNKQNYFCYNYVKLPPNLTIFGTMMANCLKLYEVHSISNLT